MPMVYEDDADAQAIMMNDYLQVEDFEEGGEWPGYLKVTEGVDDLYEAGLGRIGWGRRWGGRRRVPPGIAKKIQKVLAARRYAAMNPPIRPPRPPARFGRPPWSRKQQLRRVPMIRVTERGGRHTRTVNPPWFSGIKHPRTVERVRGVWKPRWGRRVGSRRRRRDIRWARKIQRKAQKQSWWDRRFAHLNPVQRAALQARYTARSKRMLSRYGLMSDYLQVEGNDLDPDLGQIDIFKRVLTSIGLRNPLNHYEPEMYAAKDFDGIYRKYDADLKQWRARVHALGSNTAKGPLLKKVDEARSDLNRAGAALGGTWGERDQDRLGAAIQEVRFLGREIRAAEKEYGTRATAPPPKAIAKPTEEKPVPGIPLPPPEPEKAGIPILPIGLAVVGAKLVGII